MNNKHSVCNLLTVTW